MIENIKAARAAKQKKGAHKSSRSHCIITMQKPNSGKRLYFVDLAGAETTSYHGGATLEQKVYARGRLGDKSGYIGTREIID
eukprot:UN00419